MPQPLCPQSYHDAQSPSLIPLLISPVVAHLAREFFPIEKTRIYPTEKSEQRRILHRRTSCP